MKISFCGVEPAGKDAFSPYGYLTTLTTVFIRAIRSVGLCPVRNEAAVSPLSVRWNLNPTTIAPSCTRKQKPKWPSPNHSPSTSGELLSRVTECFYSGGELTVNELMKQIDDYMDYYNWGAMQFENKKLGPAYIQNPAYAERLNRLLWVPKVEASSTRIRIFRRPLLYINQRSAGN